MSSDHSSNNFHEIEPQKSFRIKQDNKFFSRLMSKETSIGHSSSMVYYGSASGAIPFVWESHPGTPKHLSSGTALPPLTPPPSYHHTSFKSKTKPMPRKCLKLTLFDSIFRKLNVPRKNHASLSSSSSSLSSYSSWSSSLHGSGSSSVSSFMNEKMLHRRKGYFSCSRSHVHNCMDDDHDEDDEGFGSSTSRLCFGVKVKRKNMNELGGCQSMMNMKKALLSFVSHD